MKLKHAIFLFLVVLPTAFFSACTSVESKSSDEVVIEDKTKGSSGDVIITSSDVKKEDLPITTTQASSQLAKRLLSDKTEIVASVDGFGNKTEIRYFPGNSRIRSVSLRTAADGTREVTVYAADGRAKIVNELGDEAMSLPGEQIANTAQISTSPSSPALRNYLKRQKTETQPLQPLPSSSFQQPVTPVNQMPETVQPAAGSETSTPSAKPEEEKKD